MWIFTHAGRWFADLKTLVPYFSLQIYDVMLLTDFIYCFASTLKYDLYYQHMLTMKDIKLEFFKRHSVPLDPEIRENCSVIY